jgi:hypothetical protein
MTTANTGVAADDFIPAPDAGEEAPAETNAGTADPIGMQPIDASEGIGQTELILALVGVLALAGLLLLVKTSVRKSLIASRATIDAANAAGWSWYAALLAFGALVIAGIAGGLFGDPVFIALTLGVLIVGLLIALRMTARARKSA